MVARNFGAEEPVIRAIDRRPNRVILQCLDVQLVICFVNLLRKTFVSEAASMYVLTPSATETPPGISRTKLLSDFSVVFSLSQYIVRTVSISLLIEREMATQVLKRNSLLSGLATTAGVINHGLTIANAVKSAAPVIRSLGTAAMAFL